MREGSRERNRTLLWPLLNPLRELDRSAYGRVSLRCLRSGLNLAEALTELKRSASSVAHIDQNVKDPEEFLPQLQAHRRLPVGKVLN